MNRGRVTFRCFFATTDADVTEEHLKAISAMSGGTIDRIKTMVGSKVTFSDWRWTSNAIEVSDELPENELMTILELVVLSQKIIRTIQKRFLQIQVTVDGNCDSFNGVTFSPKLLRLVVALDALIDVAVEYK